MFCHVYGELCTITNNIYAKYVNCNILRMQVCINTALVLYFFLVCQAILRGRLDLSREALGDTEADIEVVRSRRAEESRPSLVANEGGGSRAGQAIAGTT